MQLLQKQVAELQAQNTALTSQLSAAEAAPLAVAVHPSTHLLRPYRQAGGADQAVLVSKFSAVVAHLQDEIAAQETAMQRMVPCV